MKNLRVVLALAFVLSYYLVSFAQAPDTLWSRHYGGSWSEYGNELIATADGGFALAGNAQQDSAGDNYFYLVRTDANGDQLWTGYYGFEFVNSYAQDLKETSDGGFILAGYTGEDPDYQALAVKTDAAGNQEWIQFYGGDFNDQFYSVVETDDGGFLCAGKSNESGNTDMYLMKLDAGGNEQWTRYYGDTDDQNVNRIIKLADGNYMIGGYDYVVMASTPFLMKVNADGNSLWSAVFDGENLYCYNFDQTSDGGFIMGLLHWEGWSYQGAVMKADAAGNQEWLTDTGGYGVDGVVEDVNGGYIYCGTSATWPPSDIQMGKLGNGGGEVWTVVMDAGGTGTSYDWATGVIQTSDEGYAVTGSVFTNDLSNQMYLFRFDAEPPAPNLATTLTPFNPPIEIPANGGSFDFNIAVENLEPSSVTMDIWTMITLPSGNEYGPVINVSDMSVPAGAALDRDRTQAIPSGAPSGNYTYDAYLGVYPATVWAEDHFEFSKSAVTDGNPPVSGWENRGESFDGPDAAFTDVPAEFGLSPAYPNPFNPETTLNFTLKNSSAVTLIVYDVQGREVAVLADGWYSGGTYEIQFNGFDLTSGVYFANLNAGNLQATQKLLLVK